MVLQNLNDPFLPLGLGCLHSSRFRILRLNEVQIVHIVQALKDFRQVEIFCPTDLELSRPGMKKVFEALLSYLILPFFICRGRYHLIQIDQSKSTIQLLFDLAEILFPK